MINAVTISDYISRYDQKRLVNCCKKDDMVDEFLQEVTSIITWNILTPMPLPPDALKWISDRKKAKCRSEVETQIKSTINMLEKLSLPALRHITKSQSEYDAYCVVLNALKKPYAPKKKYSRKTELIKDISQLMTKYDIEVSRNDKSDLFCILQIIIDAADLSHDVADIARGITDFG